MRGKDHGGRAITALQAVGLAERILNHAEFARRRRKSFDGRDVVAVGLYREHQAGSHRLAVDQHGAGPADAVLAAGVGAVEKKVFAQRVEQRLAWLDISGTDDTIDAQVNLHRASPAGLAVALSRACSIARMPSVAATRRR